MPNAIVSLQKKGPVLVFNIKGQGRRVKKQEALSQGILEALEENLSGKEIRAVVFNGIHSDSFQVGYELVAPTAADLESGVVDFTAAVASIEMPTVIAIEGDAVGLGLELALACDIRIAATRARFGFPDIRKGMLPCHGGTQRLSRIVGKGKALEMILTGDLVDAEEAYRTGLIGTFVPQGKAAAAAIRLAGELSSQAPIALKYAKEAVYKGSDMTLEQGLRLEADLYFLLHSTRDRTRGIRGFQKRGKTSI